VLVEPANYKQFRSIIIQALWGRETYELLFIGIPLYCNLNPIMRMNRML
jgi:hypothetical protein